MPAFNQLVAGILNATNENSAALLSAKLDFSLFKVEAPLEFTAIGPALSTRCRREAELGRVHRTARRLAALFEQRIPSTPKLIAAYGTRVSSIACDPRANPKGSTREGCFAPFVGINGTAVWAAATSGVPAIGMYLLACLLARAWSSKEATSICVELVEDRKIEVRKATPMRSFPNQPSLALYRKSPEQTLHNGMTARTRHEGG